MFHNNYGIYIGAIESTLILGAYLDSVTEKKIQDSLDLLSAGRTCIVIAHRLSTVRNADQIAVIENQGISEIGTRKDLLARDGIYAALERAQEMEV